MPTKTVRATTKLDEKEQLQRDRVIQFFSDMGMPWVETVVDSTIYRKGLEAYNEQISDAENAKGGGQ